MKLFCLVLVAMAFMWSGRNGRVEAGATQNDFTDSSLNDANPFVNHLGIRAKHLEVDTSDLEERDTEWDHFTPGFGRIRRIPVPIDAERSVDENQNGDFRFKNNLLRRRYFEEGLGSDGGFPFIPGVLRRDASETPKKSETVDFEKTDDQYPFLNGLRELPMSRASNKLGKEDNFHSNNHPVKTLSPKNKIDEDDLEVSQ